MATRINLRDGSQAIVQATIDQLRGALQTAIARGQLVEIEQPGGKIAVINPHEVVSFQEEPEAAQELADRFQAAAG
ncbi:MAG TPA: hypothetical protein VMD79_12230 [Solirubrobacteraceae bacterium]|nr:hypothetical protein [Solirubrobacteraceae bacterium]